MGRDVCNRWSGMMHACLRIVEDRFSICLGPSSIRCSPSAGWNFHPGGNSCLTCDIASGRRDVAGDAFASLAQRKNIARRCSTVPA
jgi:hypothetical protein